YEPKRNAQLDIARARLQAERSQKRMVIFAGGAWCAPCIALERAINKSSRVTSILKDHFVVVYVDVAQTNDCALKDLPSTWSSPMVYVFDVTGKLLASHNPTDWQAFEGFDPHRIEAFLRTWQ
ncbi:MAG: thioredoxin family protein, partial [Candidatus Angelobacter sp.]